MQKKKIVNSYADQRIKLYESLIIDRNDCCINPVCIDRSLIYPTGFVDHSAISRSL